MNGLMMDSQLTITSIMKHADKIHGASEIVSFTADNPTHRYTYKDAFKYTTIGKCTKRIKTQKRR